MLTEYDMYTATAFEAAGVETGVFPGPEHAFS